MIYSTHPRKELPSIILVLKYVVLMVYVLRPLFYDNYKIIAI